MRIRVCWYKNAGVAGYAEAFRPVQSDSQTRGKKSCIPPERAGFLFNCKTLYNFKGGKGIAATAGLLLSFDLRLTLVAAIVFLAVFFLTHYVSLGSLLVYVVFVAGIIIMGQNGQFTGMSQANIYEMYVLAILLAILAYYKHWPNILRLIHGNENKTYLKKKKA